MKNVATHRSSAPYRPHGPKAATPSRRQFLQLVTAAAGAAAMPRQAWAQGSSEAPSRRVRVATGLLATGKARPGSAPKPSLQKAGNRRDLAVPCNWRSAGRRGAHWRRLGIRPHRNFARRGRSPQGTRDRHRGNSDLGVPQRLCHDQEGDHRPGAPDRQESRNSHGDGPDQRGGADCHRERRGQGNVPAPRQVRENL